MTKCKKEQVFKVLATVEQETANLAAGATTGTPERIFLQTGMGQSGIRNNLKKLKKEGRAHIIGWTKITPRAPVWAQGPGEDAPKPPALTPHETYARKLARRNANAKAPREIEQEAGRAWRITAETIERARQQPQTWFSQLEVA
ncbi:hypothetical protein [Massilia sp. TN1-12]|uniref:hypothetical protein n=1 Tax=Massilia paldalensis TaxID=3377675 RepID=UPI00384E110C